MKVNVVLLKLLLVSVLVNYDYIVAIIYMIFRFLYIMSVSARRVEYNLSMVMSNAMVSSNKYSLKPFIRIPCRGLNFNTERGKNEKYPGSEKTQFI